MGLLFGSSDEDFGHFDFSVFDEAETAFEESIKIAENREDIILLIRILKEYIRYKFVMLEKLIKEEKLK